MNESYYESYERYKNDWRSPYYRGMHIVRPLKPRPWNSPPHAADPYPACERAVDEALDRAIDVPVAPAEPALTEAEVRRIVRDEIAGLPIQFDVPDHPPAQ